MIRGLSCSLKNKKPKVINWEFRKSKVTQTEPKWRKNNESHPSDFNRFANNVFSEIVNNQPILKGSIVEEEVRVFLQGNSPANNSRKGPVEHSKHNKRYNKKPRTDIQEEPKNNEYNKKHNVKNKGKNRQNFK